jgi:hypothetical protein
MITVSSSRYGVTPINQKPVAGNERRVIGSEERDHPGDFLRRSRTSRHR